MRAGFHHSISLLYLSLILLWIKTYAVYKTGFMLKGDDWFQEIVLFLNPVSFLMLILGISLFFRGSLRTAYILTAHFLLTGLLLANLLFFRFFSDYLTIPLLFQTSNMNDLGSSMHELIEYTDFLYFTDWAVLVLAVWFRPHRFSSYPSGQRMRRLYFLSAMGLTFLLFALAEWERPELFTRAFDRNLLVKNIGTYHYHLYDVFLQSRVSAQKAMANSGELAEIQHYLKSKQSENNEMFAAAKGKNVILISMESAQSFVINRKVNGEEITPFLNRFLKESFYFENFYHQTGQGKTSDSEFIIENSLYPLGRGAVFFTHAQNEYRAAPEILKEHGYFTASLHANGKSFWNREVMYQSLGYDRFYHQEDYRIAPGDTINWGLNDKDFFHQSAVHLKELPRPFYAKLITLTNHFPFTLPEKVRTMDEYDSRSATLNRYIPTVRYMDEALEQFIKELKQEGLYDKSIIILYGDHYGISENHNAAMSQLMGKDITPFESIQLQRVPLIIHVPGKEGEVMSQVSGQIDVRPTILHLLGIESNEPGFGQDVFSKGNSRMTVLRDGSFITEETVYTKETCYDKKTGKVTLPASCEKEKERAGRELDYSDQIIYGDLLRFLDGDSN
ncbi:LTA synthase family protein [Bacillus massiliglaciei]|uniref:LTA synthase family protein n=1 Tax=Bacillus massiliglaciei TaxID=1816693 RepID=UPI000B2E7DE2|nr:LTA synthase family protein [Bacillus massiliglaciei]